MVRYVPNLVKIREAVVEQFGSVANKAWDQREAISKLIIVERPELRRQAKKVLKGQPVTAKSRDLWQASLGKPDLFMPSTFEGMVELTAAYNEAFPRSWYSGVSEQIDIVFASTAFGKVGDELVELIKKDKHSVDKLEAAGQAAIEGLIRVAYLHTVGVCRHSECYLDNLKAYNKCNGLLNTLEATKSQSAMEVVGMLRPAIESIKPFPRRPAYWGMLRRIVNTEEAESLAKRRSRTERFVDHNGNQELLCTLYDARGTVFHDPDHSLKTIQELKTHVESSEEAFIVDVNEIASLIRLEAGHAMQAEIPELIDRFLAKRGDFDCNEDPITTVIRGFANAAGATTLGNERDIIEQLNRLYRNKVNLTPAGSVLEVMGLNKKKSTRPTLTEVLASLRLAR